MYIYICKLYITYIDTSFHYLRKYTNIVYIINFITIIICYYIIIFSLTIYSSNLILTNNLVFTFV